MSTFKTINDYLPRLYEEFDKLSKSHVSKVVGIVSAELSKSWRMDDFIYTNVTKKLESEQELFIVTKIVETPKGIIDYYNKVVRKVIIRKETLKYLRRMNPKKISSRKWDRGIKTKGTTQ